MTTAFPPDSDSSSPLGAGLGLLSGLAGLAIILSLLAYSVVNAVNDGPRGVAAGDSSGPGRSQANPIQASGLSADSVPPALPVKLLCGGTTLVPVGRGPLFHLYIQELLDDATSQALADGVASAPSCVRTGSGGDDFR